MQTALFNRDVPETMVETIALLHKISSNMDSLSLLRQGTDRPIVIVPTEPPTTAPIDEHEPIDWALSV